jgi:hypothetical protein
VGKTKYMLVSRYQNADQNWDTEVGNRSPKNISQFGYLETRVTNQNLIQEESKRRLKICNACNHSVQKLHTSLLLSWSLNIITRL